MFVLNNDCNIPPSLIFLSKYCNKYAVDLFLRYSSTVGLRYYMWAGSRASDELFNTWITCRNLLININAFKVCCRQGAQSKQIFTKRYGNEKKEVRLKEGFSQRKHIQFHWRFRDIGDMISFNSFSVPSLFHLCYLHLCGGLCCKCAVRRKWTTTSAKFKANSFSVLLCRARDSGTLAEVKLQVATSCPNFLRVYEQKYRENKCIRNHVYSLKKVQWSAACTAQQQMVLHC